MVQQNFKLKNKLPPFTQVPNDLITGPLSPLAKATYCYLASRPDDWDFWFTNIVSVMGVGVSSVKKALKDLNDSGWIERKQTRSGGRWGATVYQVNYTPWVENRTTVAVPPLPCDGTQPANKDLLVKKIKNKDNSLAVQKKERDSFSKFKSEFLQNYPNFHFCLGYPNEFGYYQGHRGFMIRNDLIFDLEIQKFISKEDASALWEFIFHRKEQFLAQAQAQTEEIA